MFYRDQLDDLKASLQQEFADQAFSISDYPCEVILYNDKFQINVRDGIDEVYFTIKELGSDRESHISLRHFHSIAMMVKVTRMAFDEMELGYHKVKACGCPIEFKISHQPGCSQDVLVRTGASHRLPTEW